jgi:hypothetical protein
VNLKTHELEREQEWAIERPDHKKRDNLGGCPRMAFSIHLRLVSG